jgi:hypothetical protein
LGQAVLKYTFYTPGAIGTWGKFAFEHPDFLEKLCQAPTLVPSGYLTVCNGKSPFLIGKPSINGPKNPWPEGTTNPH